MSGDRERVRERYLEIVLGEVLAGSEVREVGPADARRPVRWLPAVVAAGILIVVLTLLTDEPPEMTPIEGGVVTGVVLGLDGQPAAGVDVRLEVGYVEHPFSPTRRWAAAARRATRTDEEGAFTVEGLPEGCVAMAFVRDAGASAAVPAAAEMEIRLEPEGTVEGTLVADHALLQELGVQWVGSGWSGEPRAPATVDPAGRFVLSGVPPGGGFLRVTRGRWTVAAPVGRVSAGESLDVGEVRVERRRVVGDDPLVDADRIRLVDVNGLPVEMASVHWSRPGWVGLAVTDRWGEQRFFGPPGSRAQAPYVLCLAMVGRLLGLEGRTAVIERIPRRTIVGMVSRVGGEPVGEYAVFYETERLFTGYVKDGSFLVRVPVGPGTLVVLTPDGRLHRTAMDPAPGGEPLDLHVEVKGD